MWPLFQVSESKRKRQWVSRVSATNTTAPSALMASH
jgi:hypothetical protein